MSWVDSLVDKGDKEMKVQYRAQVVHRNFNDGKWSIAIPGERYYHTLDQAMMAIQRAMDNGRPRYVQTQREDGTIGPEWYDNLEVVDSRVQSRYITDWEDVE